MYLRYFTLDEFDCQETGENNMDRKFLMALDELRHRCGFAFKVTSGYRSKNHSLEVAKVKPGKHTEGIAADIKVTNSAHRYTIIQQALEMGFTGIGISDSFIHVDIRDTLPVMWTY